MQKEVTREYILDVSGTCNMWLNEIFETENHHNHPIILSGGILRWKENPIVNDLIDNKGIDFNSLIALFYNLGFDKNSEVYRKLYRDMGYSLLGYWEIFYWDVNNPDCDKYKPNKI